MIHEYNNSRYYSHSSVEDDLIYLTELRSTQTKPDYDIYLHQQISRHFLILQYKRPISTLFYCDWLIVQQFKKAKHLGFSDLS